MKKNEIKIGECYEAKVSDRVVSVRIDSVNSHGGWNATNTATGKRVRIKSAQRLRCRTAVAEAAVTALLARCAAEVAPAADAAQSADAATLDQASPESAPAAVAPPAEAPPRVKRMSALDAAAVVLAETTTPIHVKDLIAQMAERGLWESPGGKTPAATLYAAITREITMKGDAARFRKVGRGAFTAGGADADGTPT